MSIEKLSEKRAKVLADASAIVTDHADRGEALTGEAAQRFDALTGEAKVIADAIASEKSAAEARAAADAARAEHAAVFAPTAAAGNAAPTLSELAKRNGEHTYEMRDVTKSNFTAPTNIADRVAVVAGQANPGLDASVVDLINVRDGRAILFPRQTVLPTASATAEGAQISENQGTASTATITPAKYSVLVETSAELADTGLNIEQYIAEAAGQAVGIAYGAVLWPAVAAAATVGKQGAAISPTYSDLVDLIYSVPQAGRRAAKRAFFMNDTTVAGVMKLLDTTNRPIFQPGLNGQPDTILGYPVYSAALADNGDEALSIAFGDGSAIKSVLVNGVDVKASDQFHFDYDTIVWRVQVRAAGALILPTHVKTFKGANV